MKKEKMMNEIGDDLYGRDWVGCGDEDGWWFIVDVSVENNLREDHTPK